MSDRKLASFANLWIQRAYICISDVLTYSNFTAWDDVLCPSAVESISAKATLGVTLLMSGWLLMMVLTCWVRAFNSIKLTFPQTPHLVTVISNIWHFGDGTFVHFVKGLAVNNLSNMSHSIDFWEWLWARRYPCAGIIPIVLGFTKFFLYTMEHALAIVVASIKGHTLPTTLNNFRKARHARLNISTSQRQYSTISFWKSNTYPVAKFSSYHAKNCSLSDVLIVWASSTRRRVKLGHNSDCLQCWINARNAPFLSLAVSRTFSVTRLASCENNFNCR